MPVMVENVLGLLRARQDSVKDRILGWVADHYAGDAEVGRLSRELSLSPSRTAHLVKEKTGLSLGALVTSFRVNEAKGRLRLTDDRISEVAHRVGFDDSNYFSRVFSRAVGMSPRAFRGQKHLLGEV